MAVDLVETFNYLLGLTVEKIARDPSGIVTVTGINSLGEACLVIWRNTGTTDSDVLDDWFKDKCLSGCADVDTVYVNGDNNLENLKLDKQHWEARLIEEEFKRLMFDVQDV